MKLIILGVVIVAVVIGVIFFFFGPFADRSQPVDRKVVLNYVGLWEDETLVRPALDLFESQTGIKVNYTKQSIINYRTRIQTQIREGQGPDVFRFHYSWLPMLIDDLASAPIEIYDPNTYRNTFYPIASNNLIIGDRVYSAPIEIDGLVMFYNEDLLNEANIKVPTLWSDFTRAAVTLTKKNSSGNIEIAGAALGYPGNVDHWSDILGLLFFQQPNGSPATPANASGVEVLRFFTQFITDPASKTWDKNLPNSTLMFAQGRLAFYFAPSWRVFEIIAANKDLRFKVAPMPQLPNQRITNWASFWTEGVSSRSPHQKEAWMLVKFLTSPEAMELMYSAAASVRLFGEPYSRVDMAQRLLSDPLVANFIAQGPTYTGWYLNSNTYDSGINDEMIKYFEDGVNAVLNGNDPRSALQTVQAGVNQVLNKYTQNDQQMSELN